MVHPRSLRDALRLSGKNFLEGRKDQVFYLRFRWVELEERCSSFPIDSSANKNLIVFELDGEGLLSYISHQLQGKSLLSWGL